MALLRNPRLWRVTWPAAGVLGAAAGLLVVLAVLFVHVSLTYPTLLFVFTRLNPVAFFRKLRAPMTVAFSTASSGAASATSSATWNSRSSAR